MKLTRSIILIVVLVAATVGVVFTRQAQAAVIPTVDIVSVVKDQSVSVKTNNFPANMKFDVRMGKFGTLGVNGIKITTIDSGAGGSLTQTFNIPAELKGEARIAIRLESSSGYFAYNWFDNNVSATAPAATATPKPTTTPGTGTPKPTTVVPTITIVGVVKDQAVSVKTANFPKSTKFDVRMGKFGTRGIDGIKVASIDSGSSESFTSTFSIPTDLKGESLIAIRLESATGYFSFNWFQNSTFGTTGTAEPTTVPEPTKTPAATAKPGTTATPAPTVKPGTTATPKGTAAPVPTIIITDVVKDQTVSFKTSNFPKNTSFDVRLGKMWTAGVNGIKVTTLNSGDGGSITATINIPAELKGQERIAIRLESASGYFSYDWFWND